MAEEQKPVEVAPAAEPVAETKVEETPAATTEAATTTTETPAAPAAAEATPEVEETPAAATTATEEAPKKEEVTPVEEGHLEHKGSNFPKNFLYQKKVFWFGSDPVDTKAIPTFKADKAADVAHHVAAWAAETGKGLLFFSEKGDKAAPHGAIQLAEATEPAVDGTNKFHFTSKGHKHTFKASSAAERDNWVSQLKLKIVEAKELAATIAESETYKKTLASFKPAPVAAPKKEETPVAAEAPAAEAAAPEEAPKDAEAVVPAVEEPKKEEVKKEEPKRRSASRKRGSIFGTSLFGKKEEAKKEEKPVEAAAETETPAAEASTAAATEAPAAETTAVVAGEPTPEAPAAEIPAVVDTKVEEPKAEEAKTEAKPTPSKRGSIFGNLSFGKKKAASPEPTSAPAEETPAPTEAVAETAPVIPAVETQEPLSAEVSSPATVPTEAVEAAPAATPATNGESPKKEVKSEKRKSSLPFAFGSKKDKPTSDEEGAPKSKSPSPFSRIRATIKSKAKGDKPTEKPAEGKAAEDKPAEAEAATTEAATEEVAAPIAAEPEAAPAVEEPVVAEKPLAATPVIPAAA